MGAGNGGRRRDGEREREREREMANSSAICGYINKKGSKESLKVMCGKTAVDPTPSSDLDPSVFTGTESE